VDAVQVDLLLRSWFMKRMISFGKIGVGCMGFCTETSCTKCRRYNSPSAVWRSQQLQRRHRPLSLKASPVPRSFRHRIASPMHLRHKSKGAEFSDQIAVFSQSATSSAASTECRKRPEVVFWLTVHYSPLRIPLSYCRTLKFLSKVTPETSAFFLTSCVAVSGGALKPTGERMYFDGYLLLVGVWQEGFPKLHRQRLRSS